MHSQMCVVVHLPRLLRCGPKPRLDGLPILKVDAGQQKQSPLTTTGSCSILLITTGSCVKRVRESGEKRMAEFDGDALGQEAVRMLYDYITLMIGPRMDRFWRATMLPEDLLEQYQQAPLYRDIQLLVRAANGEIERDHASEDLLDEILAAVQQVRDDLQRPPSGAGLFTLTDEFSQTPLGRMLQRVEFWLARPDLITLSEAAALYTGQADLNGLKVIQRLIAKREQRNYDQKGKQTGLQVIIDPFEQNPQHNKRVLRSEVERIKAERA